MSEEREVTFEIDEHIGVIGETKTGWTRELNKVTWNHGVSRFELRDWNQDHTKCGKGFTFNAEEAVRIAGLLSSVV